MAQRFHFFIFLLLIAMPWFPYVATAQDSSALLKEIAAFQQELLHEYNNPETTPIKPSSAKDFRGIHFFPVDTSFTVLAKFIRTSDAPVFSMPTSGSIAKQYVKYAEAVFMLKGKEYKLNIYRSVELSKQPKYRRYLFLPFRDGTSGKETYGGGRYLDLQIPIDDTIVLDFNKAYHPYCAYTDGYNCPIPPRDNTLPLKIEAGVRF